MDRTDYELDAEEANIQHMINPRHNIIQARSYIKVVEMPDKVASKSPYELGASKPVSVKGAIK